jgi:membrane-associated HD superfamily phosphohydrolase
MSCIKVITRMMMMMMMMMMMIMMMMITKCPHNINSAKLQTARLLETELQRGTRQIKRKHRTENERWLGKRMDGQLSRNLRRKASG